MHGYSSSEESDDPKRPRAQPTTSSNSSDQKKKKKVKPPPQQAINRIWKKLQARKPTTPLAILPFDPVLPPASPDRANESSNACYERAVEECRRKVRKIIKECRRVNTRYRDPGWDLDWDLKMEKGHCLNYLGHTTFDTNFSSSSNNSVPKSVKRVHEIYEKPTFLESVSSSEIIQGSIGNCWAVAALSALADVEDGIKRLCVEYDTRVGIYGFVFYRDGEWVYSIIDDKLYLKSPNWDSPSLQRQLLSQIDREDVELHYRKTYQTGSKALFMGKNKDQNETWLPLIEKAYAKAHGDYASLIGGWIGEGLEDMTGGVTTELLTSDILDTDAFWDDELSKVNKEFMFGCSTGLLDGGYGSRDGITERHAYVVMDAKTLKNGQRLLKLRNPWGKSRKGVWEGPWSDGSKEMTTDVQKELGHVFGNDSVFWISYEDLLSKYQHFDRTRLFREDGWRNCQRWIGVDVPWKPSYHEKFHIRLHKDSPLVLVLSQLDRRYFKGLQGQYNFRLHFRVHETGRPGAEDYIVRSHGNYLMTRSVSIEIPDMPAGDYTVFIMVTAERYTERPSVEDVVRRECKGRVENEKLAQVGHAYDLAHSKAHHHIEKVKELRAAADQAKASGCRKAERRKQWQRRQTERIIKKRQAEKNEAKAARLKAEKAEAWKKSVEAQESESESESELEADEQKTAEQPTSEVQEQAQPQEAKTEEKPAEDASVDDKPADEKPADEKPADEKPADEKPADEKPADEKFTDAAGDNSEKDKKPEASLGAQPAEPEHEEAKAAVSEKAAANPTPDTKPEAAKEPSKDAAKTTTSTFKPKKRSKKAKDPPPPPADTGDYSSDSPVEDWEAIYSDDDYIRKPRTQPIPETREDDRYPSEDEKLPDPWNAVCIVGFKVYSKDEDLELRVVMEGGAMEEGGMGAKGEKDLDNAQENAAGEREENGCPPMTYNPIIVQGEDEENKEAVDGKATEQTEDEDGDDESDSDDKTAKKEKKLRKKAKKETVGEADEKAEAGPSEEQSKPAETSDVAADSKDTVPAPAEEQKIEVEADSKVEADDSKVDVADQEKAETPAKDDDKAEESDDEYKKKLEEMKRKEELIKKWEEELRKKEEEIRQKEEEVQRRAAEVQKKKADEDKKDDEYFDCDGDSDSSSMGVRTADSTPSTENRDEILG